MVTASKKPKAAPKKAAPKKAAPKKAPVKKAPASKPTAKPKTTVVKAKTAKRTSAPAKAVEARKVGEMVYNDELFESISEAVLLGGSVDAALLPRIKEQLFGYDIYMVSFLDDADIAEIAKDVSGADAAELEPLLMAIRDNARVFVDIATGYNSVRAFIDRAIKDEGMDKLKVSFIEGQYCLKGAGPETCESFLILF
jgi:hypothetical protein